jgi:glycosyltransferase involved in cell wall biosynthesis
MKISIIVPYRDRPDHLRQVLDALTDQTMDTSEYEIIVIDDGSERPIDHNAFPMIKLIRTHHRGAAAARNSGIAVAKGEKLIFIDSDIVVDQSFVKDHYDFHANHQHKVVLGSRWHMDSSGVVKTSDTRLKLLARYEKTVAELTHPWFMTYTCNVSLPRELAIVEQFDENYVSWGLEDSEWAYRLSRRSCCFEFIEEMKCIHLYHDRTMTSEKYLGWEANLTYTLKKHPELTILECFKNVFNPQIKADYFETYDIFEGTKCTYI